MTEPMFRAFPTDLQKTGPRTLTGRLVPYDEVADVMDRLADGKPDIYREGFRRGAFGPQVNTPEKFAKIHLRHRHDDTGIGFLGPFKALREAEDGLYGDVTILRSKADDVEDLLAAGVNELSVEFHVPAHARFTEVDDQGVRWRTRAHLYGVALEPKGAYRSAQVLAFRQEIEAEQAEREEEEKGRADAEAVAQAEADAAAAVEEAARQRRERFEQLAGRVDKDVEIQRQLEAEYGKKRA